MPPPTESGNVEETPLTEALDWLRDAEFFLRDQYEGSPWMKALREFLRAHGVVLR